MSEPDCLRCTATMERGFLLDQAHMALMQVRWCAGDPQQSRLGLTGEVRSSQAQAGFKVAAYRCPECGYIECYANPAAPE
jgi:hypothetical protein